MDLLEYQAKDLFREVGIPTLPSQPIHDPRELKKLQIPYPVVLKSQVRVGGRGKAGGIRFVENTIDAIAAARTIFSLPILGEYPEVLLAEARYDAQEEFFLAVVLDYQLQRPVIMGSAQGGIDIEALLANLQQVVIEDEFSLFYARRLTIQMGLPKSLIESVSTIIEKMYHLFVSKDLDLVEINPLGVNAQGELMALDGKITANNHALGRHPEILSLRIGKHLEKSTDYPLAFNTTTPSAQTGTTLIGEIDGQGDIGIISNSFSLGMMTWDLLATASNQPRCCFVLQEELQGEVGGELTPTAAITQQLAAVLEQVSTGTQLKVILVNILANSEISQSIAQYLANYLPTLLQTESIAELQSTERTERATGSLSRLERQVPVRVDASQGEPITSPKFILRFLGVDLEAMRANSLAGAVHWTDNLEDALSKTISLVK